jgi:hypothetical protein
MTTIQEVLSKRFITSRLWPPRSQFEYLHLSTVGEIKSQTSHKTKKHSLKELKDKTVRELAMISRQDIGCVSRIVYTWFKACLETEEWHYYDIIL